MKRKILILAALLIFPLLFSGCQTIFCKIKYITLDKKYIISPADGKIQSIIELSADEIPVIRDVGKTARLTELKGMLGDNYKLVLIFMKPFNYHGALSPIDGKVTMIKHVPGKFKNLFIKDAYMENERMSIVIDGEIRVVIIPIAGFMYRRIKTQVELGDEVIRGQCLGRILWGSAIGLILPSNCEILVKVGDKVKVGDSIIAEIKLPSNL